MGSATPHTVSLKLLIDPKRQKVVFAEASNNCVELILSLLTMPVVSLASFLVNHNNSSPTSSKIDVSSLGTLYTSIENHSIQVLSLRLPIPEPNFFTVKMAPFYEGQICHMHEVEEDAYCKVPVPKGKPDVFYPREKERFVEAGTYMVMDDLEIKPMPTTAVLAELKKFNTKRIDGLEEKVVHLVMWQGMELLRTSTMSKSVLTDLYVEKKGRSAITASVVDAAIKITSSISNMFLR